MSVSTGYSFDWVDAFTTQAFGGNGCVVVHGMRISGQGHVLKSGILHL